MPIVKRIACLANSRKLGGRCVAGKEWLRGKAGPWVRPVSDRPDQDVSECERQYPDGSDPRVLDVIDVPLLKPRPKACQTENWLLDPNAYWEPAGRITCRVTVPVISCPTMATSTCFSPLRTR